MKKFLPPQKKTVSRTNTNNQPFFQKKSIEEPFFKPAGNGNGFSDKRAIFFPTLGNSNATSIQTKTKNSLGNDNLSGKEVAKIDSADNLGDPLGWSKCTSINADGTKHIDLTIKIGVKINSTKISKEEDVANLLDKFEKTVIDSFLKTIDKGKTTISTNIEWVKGKQEPVFYLEITDDVDEGFWYNLLGGRDSPGKVDDVGNTKENRIQVNPTHPDDVDSGQVFLHELGHTAGARHEDKETKTDHYNLMLGCPECTSISERQFKKMLEHVPEIK